MHTLRLFGGLGASVLIAAGFVPHPALAASSWNVAVGAQTSDAAVQANGFFNNNITVDVGDTVNWNWNTEELHTITLLAGGEKPALVNVVEGNLIPNATAFTPVGNGSAYDGSTFANSGVFGTGVPNSFRLTFTKAGTYGYVCLVHAGMEGTVTVNPAGTPYPSTQAGYDQQSTRDEARILTLGANGLVGRGLGQAQQSGVSVGVGQLIQNIGGVALLRFAPDKRVVHTGETVTWTNHDPQTPHTVTFGTEPPGGPFGAYPPSSNVSGGHATIRSTGDSVNSGFIANNPTYQVANTFSATFTTPGTYSYICALHDDQGMVGTIVVLP